jgi:hypothetical protein
MNSEEAKQFLLTGIQKIDPILNPVGFVFELSKTGKTHGGDFATGYYQKGNKIIQLIYRTNTGLGCVIYGYRQYTGFYIQLDVSHTALIKQIGRYNDSKLRYSDSKFASFSRDGVDPFEALSYDIQNFMLDVLTGSDTDFQEVLKQTLISTNSEEEKKRSARKSSNTILVGVISGILTGIAIVSASGNIALGVVLGCFIGIAVFTFFLRRKQD